jgi:hypothetical protein
VYKEIIVTEGVWMSSSREAILGKGCTRRGRKGKGEGVGQGGVARQDPDVAREVQVLK